MDDITVTAMFREEECFLGSVEGICRHAQAGHQWRLLEDGDEEILVFWIGIIDPTNNELQAAASRFLAQRGP